MNQPPAEVCPDRAPDVEQEELESEIVVYHPDNGNVYNLNGTGAFVWSLCDGEHSLRDMVEVIAEEAPGTDVEQIMNDVREFVVEMREEGLIRSESVEG